MAKTPTIQQQQRMAQQMAQMQNPTAIKTKKYALEKNTYIKLAMKQLIRTQWMWGAVPLAIIIINIILNVTKAYPNYWIYIFAFVGALLYIAFWAIQFMGITQLEQYKQLFQKFRYEIDSRQIFVKVSDKEGGVMKWDMILKAEKTQDAYVMELGKAQFLYLPFDIFTSDNDRKLMDKILRDKGLVL